MATVKVEKTEISGALLQTKVEGERSLKCAIYYAIFSLFNDIFILPLLVIIILYLGVSTGEPPGDYGPGDNYLCKCCDTWSYFNDIYYCCSCTNTGDDGEYGGNSLGDAWLDFTIGMIFGLFGAYDLLMLVVSLFSFIALCLWGNEIKEAFLKGMSLFGLRYRKEGMIIALCARLLLFIATLILFFTKPDVHCGCVDGSTFAMQFGPQYGVFKACYAMMVVYLVFNLLFLLSRRILLGLLRNVKVTTDMVLFQLCYVRVEQM
eukprot:497554_1